MVSGQLPIYRNWSFTPDYYSRSQDVLETAISRVSAYRSWQAYDPGREYHIDARYAALPALTKKDIRQHFPDGLVPADRNVQAGLDNGEISFVKTSGTVDMSVTNIWYQPWWDASEKASWQLNAHTRRLATGDHPEAILVNSMNVGIISDDADLPMEKRRLGRFLYLNEKTDPLSWTPALMDRMIAELAEFKPVVLEANASFLARLCRYITAGGKTVFQPGLIVLTYEFNTRLHYRQIQRVFTCPVISSYGTTETGYVFMQCEAGKFHQNSEYCRVDFQPFKPEHGGPRLGRILVTTFNNPWYYLVRFDVGDLVYLDASGQCSCGRNSGLILTTIAGRTAGVTLTTGGRPVTQRELDDTLSQLDDIDEYRLEQADRNSYNLYLVSGRQDKTGLTGEAVALLRSLYGKNAAVSVSYEPSLAPESSGKYRSAKALFPVDIEQYLDEKYHVKKFQ